MCANKKVFKNNIISKKILKQKKTESVAQVAVHLPSNHKSLSSNSTIAKKKANLTLRNPTFSNH
jgi:hypothetical protein